MEEGGGEKGEDVIWFRIRRRRRRKGGRAGEEKGEDVITHGICPGWRDLSPRWESLKRCAMQTPLRQKAKGMVLTSRHTCHSRPVAACLNGLFFHIYSLSRFGWVWRSSQWQRASTTVGINLRGAMTLNTDLILLATETQDRMWKKMDVAIFLDNYWPPILFKTERETKETMN